MKQENEAKDSLEKVASSQDDSGRNSLLTNVSQGLSELSTGKKVAAGVGLAVVAGGVAAIRAARARSITQSPRTIYHLEPKEDGWILTLEGATGIQANFETKEEGLTAARELANESAPSELVIHLSDGSEQTRHSYEP